MSELPATPETPRPPKRARKDGRVVVNERVETVTGRASRKVEANPVRAFLLRCRGVVVGAEEALAEFDADRKVTGQMLDRYIALRTWANKRPDVPST